MRAKLVDRIPAEPLVQSAGIVINAAPYTHDVDRPA